MFGELKLVLSIVEVFRHFAVHSIVLRSPQNSLGLQCLSGSCFPLLGEVTTFYLFLYFLGYSAYLYQVQLYAMKLRVHTYVSQLTFG